MKWRIQVPEVHYSIREVEADTKEEAIDMALEDLDTEFQFEYSHTLWDEVRVDEIDEIK